MQELHITTNPLDPNAWEIHQVEDCRPFLMSYFKGRWPATARVYHEKIDKQHDVTPTEGRNHELLAKLEGKVYVVVYPQGQDVVDITKKAFTVGTFIFQPVFIGANFLATKALSFAFKPDNVKAPREQTSGSSNNSLGQRKNEARVNGRIPDIYGQVRAYPDLVQAPYRTFVNNIEVENLYLCIGRGEYAIDADLVKDGDTPISNIPNAKCAIYGPNTSPNSGTPQLEIGGTIDSPVVKILRLNEVDGQVLQGTHRMNIPSMPEFHSKVQPHRWIFGPVTHIQIQTSDEPYEAPADYDLADHFPIGQQVTITGAKFPSNLSVNPGDPQAHGIGAGTSIDLDGTYTILDHVGSNPVTGIILDDPGSVNSDWDGGFTAAFNRPILSLRHTDGISFAMSNWIGPFFVNQADLEQVWCNFIAPNGLHVFDDQNQYALVATIQVGLTPCTDEGVSVGDEEFFEVELHGSSVRIAPVAVTHKMTPTTGGPQLIRARMLSLASYNTDGNLIDLFSNANQPAWTGQLHDEVQWLDAYAATIVTEEHFGDVTTAQVEILKTPRALTVKERKFNCVVTRVLPIWNGTSYDTPAPTRRALDALLHMIHDNYIGRTYASPLINFADEQAIEAALTAVQNYFGMALSVQFDYTFDKPEISFEDMVGTVASATFINVYRLGSLITASPDIATTEPVAICNHRNKVPGSEQRHVSFSSYNDHDSVEVDYVDPELGTVHTYVFPSDEPRFSPKAVEVVGLSSRQQAFWHGQRAYAKLKHQNTLVEFEATQDLARVAVKDKILVARNTTPIDDATAPVDGEILGVSGLILTTSQPTIHLGEGDKTVFLEYADGTIEGIPCNTGLGTNRIDLLEAPSQTIITDPNEGHRTRYIVALDNDRIPRTFHVVEKESSGPMTYNIKAVNISPVVYLGDNISVWLEPIDDNFLDSGPHRWGRTITGTPSVEFNGGGILPRNDTIYVGDTNGQRIDFVSPSTPTYTYAAWVRVDHTQGNIHTIVTTAGGARGINFVVSPSNDGQLRILHQNQLQASAAYPDDTDWHHVAVTHDDDTGIVTLYIDGQIVDQEETTFEPGSSSGLSIGGNQGQDTETLIGNLWWVRVWSRALTSEEIYDDYRTTRKR